MLLTELPFLPSLYYCSFLCRFSGLRIEAQENYNKGSFRNKTFIKSNQGSRYLNVPLQQGKHGGEPVQGIRISFDESWKQNLEKTLQSEYGKYPYFEIYFEDMRPMFHTEPPHYFFPVSLKLFIWILRSLELKPPSLTTKYEADPAPGIVDVRDRITPAFFRQHPYLAEEQKLDYFYFTPGHTILEAMFAYGPEVAWLIRRYAKSIDLSWLESGEDSGVQ